MHFSKHQAEKWVHSMGEHWALPQTTAEGAKIGVKFDKFNEYEWWAALNMIYSDFHSSDRTVTDYVNLAHKFLCDDDGFDPSEKLYRYYTYVAKH